MFKVPTPSCPSRKQRSPPVHLGVDCESNHASNQLGGETQVQNLHAVLKNTFIEAVELRIDTLRRSSSDSVLSQASRFSDSHSSASSGLGGEVTSINGVSFQKWQPYATGRQPMHGFDNSSEIRSGSGSGVSRVKDPMESYEGSDLCQPAMPNEQTAPTNQKEFPDHWCQETRPGMTNMLSIASQESDTTSTRSSVTEHAAKIELDMLANKFQALEQKQQIPLPSLGSDKHDVGECSPCVFWFKRSCVKGVSCQYCHYFHSGQRNKRIRPSKKTRDHMRVARQLQEFEN